MAKLKKASQLTEHEAIALLRTKFDSQGYALFPQVPDGTGARKKRTADAIMMSLWPSRGLHLYGIEYKRTVSDWRNELKKPDKADSIGRFCDFWYMLAPVGVINVLEVPQGWGLWEIDDRHRLLRTREAPENLHKEPIDLSFIAGLLRAAQNALGSSRFKDARSKEEYRRGFEAGKNDAAYSHKQRQRDFENLKKQLEEFQEASGIKINGWAGGAYLGEEVREGLKLLSDPRPHVRTAQHVLEQTEQLNKAATALVELLQAQTS